MGNQFFDMIEQDVFVIPIKAEYLIYSPLRQILLLTNFTGVNKISQYLESSSIVESEDIFYQNIEKLGLLKPINPESAGELFMKRRPPFTRVSLALTNDCNLKCIYCYASCGTKSDVMTDYLIEDSINFSFENCQKSHLDEFHLGFHGTGEATIVWKKVVTAVTIAEKLCVENGINPFFSFITNAYRLSEQQVKFMKDHNFHVSVSMDGFKKIQDIQRPSRNNYGSFDNVMKSINKLQAYGVKFSIRATCTQESIPFLPEIVNFFSDSVFKGNGGKIHFEPVEVCGRAVEYSHIATTPDEFIQEYKKAVVIAEELGIKLNCSGDLRGGLQTTFCGANGRNLIILPNGLITSCSRVTDEAHRLSNTFIYGQYNELSRTFSFDEEKLAALQKIDVSNFDSCRKCYARWHCAGNCVVSKLSGDNHWEDSCKITRELVKWRLIRLLKSGKA